MVTMATTAVVALETVMDLRKATGRVTDLVVMPGLVTDLGVDMDWDRVNGLDVDHVVDQVMIQA